MERLRTVIVSDKEKAGLRERIRAAMEGMPNLDVVLLSRSKISRIRSEIVPKEPAVVLVAASLQHPAEVDELGGFVRKLRRHLPETNIVIHAPGLFEPQLEEIFQAGADAWIDERIAYEYLGSAVESIATGQDFVHPMVKRRR